MEGENEEADEEEEGGTKDGSGEGEGGAKAAKTGKAGGRAPSSPSLPFPALIGEWRQRGEDAAVDGSDGWSVGSGEWKMGGGGSLSVAVALARRPAGSRCRGGRAQRAAPDGAQQLRGG